MRFFFEFHLLLCEKIKIENYQNNHLYDRQVERESSIVGAISNVA